jgi:hypothetical protein
MDAMFWRDVTYAFNNNSIKRDVWGMNNMEITKKTIDRSLVNEHPICPPSNLLNPLL